MCSRLLIEVDTGRELSGGKGRLDWDHIMIFELHLARVFSIPPFYHIFRNISFMSDLHFGSMEGDSLHLNEGLSLMRDAIPLNATSHESLVVCPYAFVQYSSSLPRHGGKTKNVLKYRQEDAALYRWKVEKLPRFP